MEMLMCNKGHCLKCDSRACRADKPTCTSCLQCEKINANVREIKKKARKEAAEKKQEQWLRERLGEAGAEEAILEKKKKKLAELDALHRET